ncbi:tumor necrosis factor receptor superfamily, member a isoform X2 [Pangasianodon hypophthalmus]|uniref:tumor necrosis factor receptor superfamily, member a isoform X2 n=1 Tax=Pangasianodon hypophthalmus TaxID=310915 RepID=UPI002306E907|nr:tumor necrosis factor receptor superfamily, member a isoform X2 [Pangasianodon hypophthalmus]
MGKELSMEHTVFLLVLALTVVSRGAAEVGLHLNQTAKQHVCVENQEYPHNGFCCKNCEAGTYVKEKCTADQEKGKCEPCKEGTYAEHPTGMDQCLQCSNCPAGQITTEMCTNTGNTKCECKPGTFCLPDEPCEVCKKCTRCKADEIEERPCTPTSNTKCKKRPLSPHDPTVTPTISPAPRNDSHGTTVSVVLGLLCFILLLVGVGVVVLQKRRLCRKQASPVAQNNEVKIPIDGVSVPTSEECENSRNAGLEEAELPRTEFRPLLQETHILGGKSIPVEDEDRGLGDSLPNTTSSSQTSLSALPVNMPLPVSANCEREAESWAREDGTPRRLVPLLAEEVSLSKSFDLFDVLDVRVHNKFFRSIGVSDNAIKLAESHNASDKVYELLRVWMQREGLRANINHLLQALLDLDQRYSAEQIASRAVERGYYKYE